MKPRRVHPLAWVAGLILLAIVLLPTGSNPDGPIPAPYGLIGAVLVVALVLVGLTAGRKI